MCEGAHGTLFKSNPQIMIIRMDSGAIGFFICNLPSVALLNTFVSQFFTSICLFSESIGGWTTEPRK